MDAEPAVSSIAVLVIGLIVTVVGMLCLWLFARTRKPTAVLGDSSWTTAQGKIVDLEPVPNAGTPRWRPIYAFDPVKGEAIRGKAENDDYVSNRSSLGNHRTVSYNPTNPRQFQVGPAQQGDLGLYVGIALASIGAATVVAWAMG